MSRVFTCCTSFQYFRYVKGRRPQEFEEEILASGNVFVMDPLSARATFHRTVERYGEQPFRVGKVNIFHSYAGMIMPKDSLLKDQLQARKGL